MNQIRIRDTVEAGDNIFEIQRLENMDMDIISGEFSILSTRFRNWILMKKR